VLPAVEGAVGRWRCDGRIFRYQPTHVLRDGQKGCSAREANIGRLTRMIAEMSINSSSSSSPLQANMESAQALYGVTMQEATDVSRLVSVKFNAAEAGA